MARTSTDIETVAVPSHNMADNDMGIKGEIAYEGYELFEDSAPTPITPEQSKAVRRKIDLHLLPLMCALYGLNYVDKVAMGYAVLFDFRSDLNLVGTDYSWASSMFYFGYLAAQYPANYILQRYQTARILSLSVITWGILMLA